MPVMPPPAPGVKARPPSPPGRPPTRRWPLVAAVAGTALVAGLVGVLIGSAGDDDADADRVVTADERPPVIVEGAATGGPLPVRAVVDAVGPSVVTISADLVQGRSVGTGIVLSADGEILTNAHVVDGRDRDPGPPARRDRADRRPSSSRPTPATTSPCCRSTATTSCR